MTRVRLVVNVIGQEGRKLGQRVVFDQVQTSPDNVLGEVDNGWSILDGALNAGRATLAAELWGGGAHWELDGGEHPHEANLLALDASKAQRELGWRNRLGFRDALAWTIDWERRVYAGADALTVTREQIGAFQGLK